MSSPGSSQRARWRDRLHEIIFEADTPAGKIFDIALLVTIGASLVTVMLESVEAVNAHYERTLRITDLVITFLFTIEYILRLVCVDRPLRYARSFFGVVDVLAIVPGLISILFAGAQSMLVIRALRLLRVFRVFKMSHYLGEAALLVTALRASRTKITVFLTSVLIITVNMGALMYLVEGEEAGFTSIPRGIYWAIVTMTTVGYGDIAPQTALGQLISAALMVAGYAILAVPTGIVTAELTNVSRQQSRITTLVCPSCAGEGHDSDATFCKHCGAKL